MKNKYQARRKKIRLNKKEHKIKRLNKHKLSHIVHAVGRGFINIYPPPLSLVKVIIEGHTKKQIIMFLKKNKFRQF